GRDVLFCIVPQWSVVQSLADTLAAHPDHAVAAAVRAAVFHDQGIAFDPKDPLLAAAADLRAGPPIGGLRTTKIGQQRGRLLVCAADTLFLPEGAGQVARARAGGDTADALFAATFEALGVALPPDSPFAAAARAGSLGAPLGPIQSLNHQGHTYAVQVYALDTLVAADPQGHAMQRLSALAGAPAQKGLLNTPGEVQAIQVAPLHGDATTLVDVGSDHDLTGAHLLITRRGYVLPVPRTQIGGGATDPATLLVLVAQEEGATALNETQAKTLDRLLVAFEHRYRLPR